MKKFFNKWFSKEGIKKIFYSFIWISVLVFIADIVSKWAVQNSLKIEGNYVTLIPNFLHITLHYNSGASFGMGSSGEVGWRIFWIFVSVIFSGVLVFIFAKYHAKFTKLQTISLTLMIGGAFGNMIDRCFYWSSLVGFDGVVDWIDFQFGSWHFATFNLADSSLVIGVLILITAEIITTIKEVREKDKRGEYDLPPVELEKQNKENAENKDK